MRQVRQSVFETNSSSTHSLTIGELAEEEIEISYKFPSISLRPVHFGYDDIIAPSDFSNNFPDMKEMCNGCEYLKCGRWDDANCTNPEYRKMITNGSHKWWNSNFENKCQQYIKAKENAMEEIAANQSPNDRASALLPCIVHYCTNPAETIKAYFDKLFDICEKVYYEGKEFYKEQNVKSYWNEAIGTGWGDYDSRCWMETHESSLETKDVNRVLNSIESVKAYLFGKGSYAMGDRNG